MKFLFRAEVVRAVTGILPTPSGIETEAMAVAGGHVVGRIGNPSYRASPSREVDHRATAEGRYDRNEH